MCAMVTKVSRVLFVDEDSNSRIKIAIELENRGYKVTVAPSGNRAKICLRGQRYMAVVSEYKMSDGSGPELFQFIKVQQPKTRFVFFTSDDVDYDLFNQSSIFWGVIDKAQPNSLFALLKQIQGGVLQLKG